MRNIITSLALHVCLCCIELLRRLRYIGVYIYIDIDIFFTGNIYTCSSSSLNDYSNCSTTQLVVCCRTIRVKLIHCSHVVKLRWKMTI